MEKTLETKDKINEYRKSLNAINKVAKRLPNSKVRVKTIPAIFNKTFDENFISDFLAYILNPKDNGIGLDPLVNLILKFQGDGFSESEIESINPEEVRISREYTFENDRRVDILIEIGNNDIVVAIENKIYSGEGWDQTKDYTKSIEKLFSAYKSSILLFLTPNKTKPASEKFQPISYGELVKILKNVKYDFTKDIRRSILFNEFIIHMEEYIMGENKALGLSEKSKLYIENYELMKDMEKSFRNDLNNLIAYIQDKILSLFGEDWQVGNGRLGGDVGNYRAIYKPGWRIKDINVHFELWIIDDVLLREHKIYFMVHAEGKNHGKFIEQYQKLHDKIDDIYHKNNIKHHPDALGQSTSLDRFAAKYSIAFKEYCFSKKEDEFKQQDIDATLLVVSKDFGSVAELIDETFKKL